MVGEEVHLEMSYQSTVTAIAADYFALLGSHFPYQCASDEFYWLPRSEAALSHLGRLDEINEEMVDGLLSQVKHLMVVMPFTSFPDVEDEIDRRTLRKSMERFLWDYGRRRVWRGDPTLYVKIPLFAVDEALSRTETSNGEVRELLGGLLRQIPRFLQQGLDNLSRPSALSGAVAREMAADALVFFQRDVTRFIQEHLAEDPHLLRMNQGAVAAWAFYHDGLCRIESEPSFAMGDSLLGEMLIACVDYARSPAEVLETAESGFQSTLAAIVRHARTIDPRTAWQALVRNEDVAAESSAHVLELYREEVRALRAFFASGAILTFPPREEVHVLPTPEYLRSLRATASYRAPLTGRSGEPGIFYITPGAALSGIVLSHKPYLSAHETYPGHHILDTIRLRNPNPVRRQIESPLFYEGWATYAETLLDELGYTTDPKERLVQLQRQLWRDLRAVIDMKLQMGSITMEEAAGIIHWMGFSAETARRQVRRFALTPGYQSCYFLGMREILRIRARFEAKLGLCRFHDLLLEGGQLPFDLVEQRLEAAVNHG